MPDPAEYAKPTLVEIMAPNCVECRAMQPDLDAVAAGYKGLVDLVVVDATREKEKVASLRVLGTPTLIAVQNGVEVKRFTGRRSRRELDQLFAALAVDSAADVTTTSRSDRVVGVTAGSLLVGAGVASGPAWVLVAIGIVVAGFSLLRGRSS